MFCDKEFIGKKLKEYRKKANLSQEQIAEKTGLAEKHYGRLERGICTPTLETFFTLVDVLHIPLTEFGLNIKEGKNKNSNRDNLLKTIYSSTDADIELITNLINSVNIYKSKRNC